MDLENALTSAPPSLNPLLWSTNPASQTAIWLVLASGLAAVLLVYLPLLIRLLRVSRLQRAVRRASASDEATSEAAAETTRNEIARAFQGSPLAAQWKTFSERWQSAPAFGEPRRSATRLMEVFEDQPILATGAVKSLLPALPSLFLAIGVLGSLLGLAAAVDAPLPETSMTSGSSLALPVGLALRSGLWGLILSIGAAIGSRTLEGRFDRVAEALDLEVERAFRAVSTGELTSQSAHAQHEVLSELSQELRHFASDLTERIDRGLLRVEQSTASAASLVTEQQRGALQNVVRELSVQVQSGVEQHLSALHDVLERAVDHQGTVTGGLAEAFDMMSENAQVHARVTQTLDDSSESVKQAAQAMSGTARDLAPVLAQLRETGSALAATSSSTLETQDVVALTAREIQTSIDQGRAALFEQREFIESSLDEIRHTLELMSTGLGENLSRALRNVDDALHQTVGRLRETIEESNHTIDRLAVPMRSAEGTTREMQVALERARDEVLALGEWLGEAVRPLKSNLGQLEDRAADMTRSLARFGDHTTHIDKTMDALRGEIHEESRRFRSSTAELNRNLQKIAEATGRRDDAAHPFPSSSEGRPSASSFSGQNESTSTRPTTPPSENLDPAALPTQPKSADEPASPARADSGWVPLPAPSRTEATVEDSDGQNEPNRGGKILGPDPYARAEDAARAFERQRRILESGKSLHRLEIDSPDDVLEGTDEPRLAGLLRSEPQQTTEASELDRSEQQKPREDGSTSRDERPRASAPDPYTGRTIPGSE